MGDNPFTKCDKLTSIVVNSANTLYTYDAANYIFYKGNPTDTIY